MDGPDRRAAKTLLDFWPLIVVAIGGVVTAITTWNNINGVISDQKAFKATVEERRNKTHDDLESIRTRITKLEQWKEDAK